MFRSLGININVEVDKAKLIEKVRKNRENHARILAESREGYVQAMCEQLHKLSEAFGTLGPTESLPRVELPPAPPAGHLDVFDAALSTLESHTKDTIALSADAHRNLVDDRWEWTEHFLAVAAPYSQTARS